MTQPLRLTVRSVEGERLTAETERGEAWTLPLSAVHGTPRPGMELRVIAAAAGSEDAGKTELARSILNELLGPNP